MSPLKDFIFGGDRLVFIDIDEPEVIDVEYEDLTPPQEDSEEKEES